MFSKKKSLTLGSVASGELAGSADGKRRKSKFLKKTGSLRRGELDSLNQSAAAAPGTSVGSHPSFLGPPTLSKSFDDVDRTETASPSKTELEHVPGCSSQAIVTTVAKEGEPINPSRSEEHTSELQSQFHL